MKSGFLEMPFNRILAATLIAWSAFPAAANAEWSIGAGLEDYRWQEFLVGSSLTPLETGVRGTINVEWTQDGDYGWLFAYRGKLYFGQVQYDTYTQQTYTPVSTTTHYSGVAQEAQIFHRTDVANYQLDYVGGLGLDTWRRAIENNGYFQIEDFLIIYLRGGFKIGQPKHGTGLHGGGGLKYPVTTWEDAHLDSMGYTSNPILKPGKDISLYAQLGYRISARWDVVAYYDSWRFKQSPKVTATSTTEICNGILCVYDIWQPKSNMDAFGLRVMYSF